MPAEKTTPPVAIVTGAGSGVGRATVLKFASEGWSVALLGRRRESLAETIALAPAESRARLVAVPCDLGQPDAITTTARDIISRFRRIDVLVNAAGDNIPP